MTGCTGIHRAGRFGFYHSFRRLVPAMRVLRSNLWWYGSLTHWTIPVTFFLWRAGWFVLRDMPLFSLPERWVLGSQRNAPPHGVWPLRCGLAVATFVVH